MQEKQQELKDLNNILNPKERIPNRKERRLLMKKNKKYRNLRKIKI